MRLVAPVERLDDLGGQHPPIHRAEGPEACSGRGVGQFAGLHGAQGSQFVRAELLHDVDTGRLSGGVAVVGVLQLGRRDHVGALGDRLLEQAPSRRRGHQVHDAEAPGGLPCDGDVGRIAAKGRDVAPDPAQRLDLVEQTVVAGDAVGRFPAQLRMRQPAQDSQAVVDGDHHHASPRQPGAVVDAQPARADVERAAVDPDEHRSMMRILRCPDVQREAVLAHRADVIGVEVVCRDGGLVAGRAERHGLAHALPAVRRPRRLPSGLADRRLGVGKTPEHQQVPLRLALHRSHRSFDHRPPPGMRGQARGQQGGRRAEQQGPVHHHQLVLPEVLGFSTTARARKRPMARA